MTELDVVDIQRRLEKLEQMMTNLGGMVWDMKNASDPSRSGISGGFKSDTVHRSEQVFDANGPVVLSPIPEVAARQRAEAEESLRRQRLNQAQSSQTVPGIINARDGGWGR